VLRLVAIFIIFYVLLSVLKRILSRGKGTAASRVNAQSEGEDMVLDPQCQSYVPKSTAVVQSGKYFCSPECARLYLAR
jgi:hypothetical protein